LATQVPLAKTKELFLQVSQTGTWSAMSGFKQLAQVSGQLPQ
jgi:hypothetical protein